MEKPVFCAAKWIEIIVGDGKPILLATVDARLFPYFKDADVYCFNCAGCTYEKNNQGFHVVVRIDWQKNDINVPAHNANDESFLNWIFAFKVTALNDSMNHEPWNDVNLDYKMHVRFHLVLWKN